MRVNLLVNKSEIKKVNIKLFYTVSGVFGFFLPIKL
jgi:hypothetical protein